MTCRSEQALRVAFAAAWTAAWIAFVPGSARSQSPVPAALLEPGHLLSVGEIVDPDDWRDAESVLGEAGESRVAAPTETQYDLLYVPLVVAGRTLAPGDHLQTFRLDRRIHDPSTHEPENTREQRDSWNRVWTFLDWNLDPFRDMERRTQH